MSALIANITAFFAAKGIPSEMLIKLWDNGVLQKGIWETVYMTVLSALFAYLIGLMINQFGNLFAGNANILGVIVAVILLAGLIYMLVRPYKEATKLSAKV